MAGALKRLCVVALVALGAAACGSAASVADGPALVDDDAADASDELADAAADAVAEVLASDVPKADAAKPDVPKADIADAEPADAAADSAVNAVDTAAPDAAPDVATDTSGSGDTFGGTCQKDGSPCTFDSLAALCWQGQCNYCADPDDDGACTKAYGTPTLCVEGACMPGNCRADKDCAAGQICGVTMPHVCGGCTKDAQCAGDPHYGAASMCDTATGTCGPGTCTAIGSACPGNSADICCAATAGGHCFTGSCCANGDCPGGTCIGHVCVACAAPVSGELWVDPALGSDATGSGSSACPVRTLSRAMAIVGGAPAGAVTVKVVSGSKVSTSSGETFPISIPGKVTLTASGSAPFYVVFGDGKIAFYLMGDGAGIQNADIDGSNHAGKIAVVALGGTGAATQLSNVTIHDTFDEGVGLFDAKQKGAVLSIGCGVSITGAGLPDFNHSGVAVRGSGQLTVNGTTCAAAPIHFDGNSGHGVYIADSGAVTLVGTGGSVTANGNGWAGVYITQTPTSQGGTTPLIGLTGLVATGAVYGNGMHIDAGAHVQVRGCSLGGNALSGVYIPAFASTPPVSDVSGIDLGTASSAGNNDFSGNAKTGICLDLPANAGQTLAARGNDFTSGSCHGGAAAKLKSGGGCGAKVDIGIVAPSGQTSNNSVDVAACTY